MTDLPAWIQAVGALITIVVAVWLWWHDRRRDQKDRNGRALSLAISVIPILERAQQRAAAQTDEQGLWELYDEHSDDAYETYKILPGLAGVLSDAHLLPPKVARKVQGFWAQAQERNTLVDKIRRARAQQSSEVAELRDNLKCSESLLLQSAQGALEAMRAFVKDETDRGREKVSGTFSGEK